MAPKVPRRSPFGLALLLSLAAAASRAADPATNLYATPVDAWTVRHMNATVSLPQVTTSDGDILVATPGASCAALKCGTLVPVSDYELSYIPTPSAFGFGGCVDQCNYTLTAADAYEESTITVTIGAPPRHAHY